jgi:hypothetical protein
VDGVGEEGVPVSVSDGFLKSFTAPFLNTFGADSLFVRTVSDFLTLGLTRMLIQKGRLQESDPVALFSDEEALEVLRGLTRAQPSLKVPLLQEPLGYGKAGAIEKSFDVVFGPSTFAGGSRRSKAVHSTCVEMSPAPLPEVSLCPNESDATGAA